MFRRKAVNDVEYFMRGGIYMRTYRLEIRLIQVAVGLALIVLITGFFGIWGPSSKVPVGQTGTGVTAANSAPTLSNSKIVALGDSFTLGYPLDPEHSWTQRTAEVLQVSVVNKGKIRQTAKDLLDRFDTDVVAEKPGRVIIFAGIGDAIQSVPLKSHHPRVGPSDRISWGSEKYKRNKRMGTELRSGGENLDAGFFFRTI
jgi:lysophospholipase L1-like esterase